MSVYCLVFIINHTLFVQSWQFSTVFYKDHTCTIGHIVVLSTFREGQHLVRSYMCGPLPDPPTSMTRELKQMMWRKSGFRVLKNSSQWRTVLFGVATYFLFLFLNGENLSKNKNPSMTPVRKKRSAKTRFWVRGSGYLSRRYLMRGSTPLGSKLGLY